MAHEYLLDPAFTLASRKSTLLDFMARVDLSTPVKCNALGASHVYGVGRETITNLLLQLARVSYLGGRARQETFCLWCVEDESGKVVLREHTAEQLHIVALTISHHITGKQREIEQVREQFRAAIEAAATGEELQAIALQIDAPTP